MTTDRVTFFFAIKLADRTGMGGYINSNGDVSPFQHSPMVQSLERSGAEAAAKLARTKHPRWNVEVRSSSCPACMFQGRGRYA